MNLVTRSSAASALGPSRPLFNGTPDPEEIRLRLEALLVTAVGKHPSAATGRDWFRATALLAREALAPRWVAHVQNAEGWNAKRVYYLSMEFLLGRLLTDTLRNLGLYDSCRSALARAGHDLAEIAEHEFDPALGNGGLGRLAACLLDSLATLGIPAFGYGLRFEYGLFAQNIEAGRQVEKPDHWLRHGNPWEYPRTDLVYAVPFGGAGTTGDVFAVANDMPICGYDSGCINTLRLWSAKARREFDAGRFNEGDHILAFEARTESENLTRVLYPGDASEAGRRLRFRQEFFFVSASVQDIIAQFRSAHASFDALPDKVAIAINDTHPAFVVPELMRILADEGGLEWERAWDLTRRTVSYTNHTLMPEALETWPVRFFESMLPRHLDIIYRINEAFLNDARRRHPGDEPLIERLSLVGENGERCIRMAHVAFVGSHKINGVSRIHTNLMKRTVFTDFERVTPDKIVNVTNGVTPRRWLAGANPELAALISSRIGPRWQRSLEDLGRLEECADDPEFRRQFREIKQANKIRLARHAARRCGVQPPVASLFDIHIKRIHEYKRQLLKVLHAVTLYNRLRSDTSKDFVPRTVMLAGKAAPSYAIAKLIIKLIHDVGAKINTDDAIEDRLNILFMPNYGVSEAEIIIPAADLSEQISTAGTEASGTGNMKLALNGALTIGTLDGANIEIAEAVGAENFFAFGLTVDEAAGLQTGAYDPSALYRADPELRAAIDLIADGFFSPDEPGRFRPLVDALLGEDRFLVLADYRAYLDCQDQVDEAYRDVEGWTKTAILNVARLGGLSSDRAITNYADLIWNVSPALPR